MVTSGRFRKYEQAHSRYVLRHQAGWQVIARMFHRSANLPVDRINDGRHRSNWVTKSKHTDAVLTGTVVEDESAKIACEHLGCVSEQLKLVRRWLDELEGGNRYKAFELMQLVMAGEMMCEEAFAVLDSKHNQACR